MCVCVLLVCFSEESWLIYNTNILSIDVFASFIYVWKNKDFKLETCISCIFISEVFFSLSKEFFSDTISKSRYFVFSLKITQKLAGWQMITCIFSRRKHWSIFMGLSEEDSLGKIPVKLNWYGPKSDLCVRSSTYTSVWLIFLYLLLN